MKAILLAGGTGTRLRPATLGINKHLIPVYNKPMIYYSMSILMLCKFREIILICDPKSKKIYKEMFSNGKHLGMKIQIIVQKKANGIPEAFLISEKYIKNQSVCLMLGDNFFYGQGFYKILQQGINLKKGAFFLAYNVQHPEKYAVLERNIPEAIKGYRTEQELRYLIGTGVSAASVWRLREILDEAGFEKVKIVASSGFGPEKCKVFSYANVPVNTIGTGSYLPSKWSETYATADIVSYGGKSMVKLGREFLFKK